MKAPTTRLILRALLGGAILQAALAQVPPSPRVVQFTSGQFAVDEIDHASGVLHGIFSLTYDPANRPITFRLTVTGGTALRGADFRFGTDHPLSERPLDELPSDGRVTLGNQSKPLHFVAIDDGVHELDETVELTLSDPGPDVVLGEIRKTVITIRNSPPSFRFAWFGGSWPLNEHSGLTIERWGDRETAASVHLNVSEFSAEWAGLPPALAGVDFRPFNGRVDFAPGETIKQIAITIEDQEVEGSEYVLAELSDPSPGAVVLDGQRWELGIDDNDHSPHFFVGEIAEDEFPLVQLGNEVRTEAQPHPAGGWLLRLQEDSKVLVNGVAQNGLSRLDAQGELDTTFRFVPPDDLWGWSAYGRMLGLRSGGVVFEYLATDKVRNIEMPVLRFLRADGSYDPRFPRVALENGDVVAGLGERDDGTVAILVHRYQQVNGFQKITTELIRLTGQGVRLPDVLLPEGRYGQVVFTADGESLVERVVGDDNEPWRPFTWRFLADGSLDPAFKPIEGSPALVLPDGRIVISRYGSAESDVRLIRPNGELDSSFQRTLLAGCPESSPLKILGLVNGRLRVRFGCGSPQDGYRQQAGEIILDNPPATALALSGPMTPAILLSRQPEGGVFSIPMVRLGKNSAPAIVHYTTRNVTATAGKDYVAQSGTVTFAPLETKQIVTIPILADSEDEFDETLEVVVTAAEGCEALPAPMRLTILGKSPAPRLDRVKRLRDGRVLLGAFEISRQVDGTFAPLPIEFSSDLKTWHPLTNLLEGVGLEGTPVWLDASATNAATRYYRAVAR